LSVSHRLFVMKFSIQPLFLLNMSSKQTAFNNDKIIIKTNKKLHLFYIQHWHLIQFL